MPAPADAGRTVAVTGATGFIGRRLLPQLAAAGWNLRILVRRDPADAQWAGLDIDVVQGSLDQRDALRRLVTGVDAVIHLAGCIKAPHRDDYLRANRDGCGDLAGAIAAHAPEAHLLLVSSLAAREPALSDYAFSKRAGEQAATDRLGERVSVLRPPAVYGPGDRETLAFFQLAALRWVPLLGSADARSAVIHVDDLAAAMVAMIERGASGRVEVPSDATPAGYSWRQIMQAAAEAIGAHPRGFVELPYSLLRSVAWAGDLGRRLGQANMLSSDKLRELRHRDWSVAPAERLQLDAWSPRYGLHDGFADAVVAYRRLGWLPLA